MKSDLPRRTEERGDEGQNEREIGYNTMRGKKMKKIEKEGMKDD